MTTYTKALERFHRLDRVRTFPSRCDRCAFPIWKEHRVSIIEVKGGNPLVMHDECAGRHRREEAVRP